MKVKAKTNIKYGNGWFSSGEIFDIKDSELSGLLGLVEQAGEMPAAPRQERKEEPNPVEKAPEAEPEAKPEKQEARARTSARRKKAGE